MSGLLMVWIGKASFNDFFPASTVSRSIMQAMSDAASQTEISTANQAAGSVATPRGVTAWLDYSLVLGLFLFSGGCGLIYEVLWCRQLGLIFGNTVHSLSAVLT